MLKLEIILTSGVVFVVNMYECFMENKKLRTFCGCKPLQKTTLSLINILLHELQDTEYENVKG